jgi:hypothetical protein
MKEVPEMKIKKITWLKRTTYGTAKLVVASTFWFFSSMIVAPIYVALIDPLIVGNKKGIVAGLSLMGGAVAWFILIYILVSIFIWRMQKSGRI